MEAVWDRVALAVSAVEPQQRGDWRARFRGILADFRFLPGGGILAHAGTPRPATLFDSFAMGPVEDSIHGIFNSLRETMLSLQAGAGVGMDFSTLRPVGACAASSDGVASGPLSFMKVWEAANTALQQGNPWRGAMMASLRCDHPDIETLIDAKLDRRAAPHFLLSVAITDDFMRAVERDRSWPLVFPLGSAPIPDGAEVLERMWPGSAAPQLCLVHRRIPARVLWDKLVAAEHACAEPGVVFVDRIQRDNNLWYCEQLASTLPGAEIALPPHAACSLGSINLTRFVQHPFTAQSRLDLQALASVAAIATRFLDNVHELSHFPLKSQEMATRAKRRIGLGITGLADALAMLGLRYGSPDSRELAHDTMQMIRDTAYQTSISLAQEKGSFSAWDKRKFGASPFVSNLPHHLQDAITEHGIRNSHLLAVAPADAINLLANNVSSGIEPVFAFRVVRRVAGPDGQMLSVELDDDAAHQYAQLQGGHGAWPAHFVQAADVSAEDQLRMMASVQACVDQAIAKTVRLPRSTNAQETGIVLRRAWELGLRGCAVARQDTRADAPTSASQRADEHRQMREPAETATSLFQ